MSLLNRNISVKIDSIYHMNWNKASVSVSARPYHALLFRYRGSAVFTNGSTKLVSDSGDVTYMPSGYPYHADYTSENEVYVIHFEAPERLTMENYKVQLPEYMFSLFTDAFQIWNNKQIGFYYRAASLFYEILSALSLQTFQQHNHSTVDNFFKAVDYMKTHFNQSDITVAKLSDIANMSDTYFRRLFTELMNETPSDYLEKLRLEYAEEMLSTGKYSVAEIADMAGYHDPKYFSRVVKKKMGSPPSRLFVHK